MSRTPNLDINDFGQQDGPIASIAASNAEYAWHMVKSRILGTFW